MHPRGRVLRGVLVREGARSGVPWLDSTGEDPVLVRFSRGGGLPSTLPDVLGLAVRVGPDGDRPGDLLFSSTGLGRLTRFVLVPTRRASAPMSTLVPFRTAVGPVVLAAQRTGRSTIELRCATLGGPWTRFGTIHLEDEVERAPEGEQPELAFDPVNHLLSGLKAYDWVRLLREPSYATARAGRSARLDGGGAPADDEHVLTDDELADEMSEESFPGSDPPSTWAGPAT